MSESGVAPLLQVCSQHVYETIDESTWRRARVYLGSVPPLQVAHYSGESIRVSILASQFREFYALVISMRSFAYHGSCLITALIVARILPGQ